MQKEVDVGTAVDVEEDDELDVRWSTGIGCRLGAVVPGRRVSTDARRHGPAMTRPIAEGRQRESPTDEHEAQVPCQR